ncbi:MAG: peptidylprolyl isomerase [Gemmatimonadetes bacterium]|nr:peptidylprolyl isomerase [Gemmatimonadota bacterium]
MKQTIPLPTLMAPLAAIVVLLTAVPESFAQMEREELVDEVVAIVGDSVIVLSQVIQQENQWRAQGRPVPEEGTRERDEFREDRLEDLVEQLLVLQAAAQDTLLEVEDERVEDQLQERMAQIESNFGSRTAMEQQLEIEGLTIQSYREMMREQIAQEQLVQLYMARHGDQGAVEVTEDEMRAFFEEGRATLEERPATVTFKQVMLSVAPSDSSRQAARETLEALLERARAGEDFAELATEYSQDPGSATAGGDLGWFRRGDMVDEFEETAFTMLEGGISEVVETIHGFHIILLERMRVAERRARHILIRPETGPQDNARTRRVAEEVAARAATDDFEALIDEYHDTSLPDSATVPLRQIAQILPAAYLVALTGREEGEVVGPLQFGYLGQERFAVLKIVEQRDAGEFTYEDLEPQIRATLMRQKRVEALMANLRARTYVEYVN